MALIFMPRRAAFAGDVGAAKDELHCSIPPLRDQADARVWRHVVFLDRLLDRGLLVHSINETDELGPRAADMVDRPGVGLFLGRWLSHSEKHCSAKRPGAASVKRRAVKRDGPK
jgi:hypothetical protein